MQTKCKRASERNEKRICLRLVIVVKKKLRISLGLAVRWLFLGFNFVMNCLGFKEFTFLFVWCLFNLIFIFFVSFFIPLLGFVRIERISSQGFHQKKGLPIHIMIPLKISKTISNVGRCAWRKQMSEYKRLSNKYHKKHSNYEI